MLGPKKTVGRLLLWIEILFLTPRNLTLTERMNSSRASSGAKFERYQGSRWRRFEMGAAMCVLVEVQNMNCICTLTCT